MLNALALLPSGSIRPTASIHRLRRGLPGYLIRFAPHAFVSQCQNRPSELPSPLVFFPVSTDFTPPPRIPLASACLNPAHLSCSFRVEPGDLTEDAARHLHYSLRPVIPGNAWVLRMTAAAGTELANPYSFGTVIIFPNKSSLRPEGLHPARGVAASDLRPLRKIPSCCPP